MVSRNVGSLCDEFRSFASGHGSNASEMNAGSGEVMASNPRNVSRWDGGMNAMQVNNAAAAAAAAGVSDRRDNGNSLQ